MRTIVTLYSPDCADFSNNGLGLLEPLECTVEEHANGMYELAMELPITDNSRFQLVKCGCVVKAEAPVRDAPISAEAVQPSGGGEIWKIGEPQWVLDLRAGPGKGYKDLAYLSNSAEFYMLEYGASWSHVEVIASGQVGYVQTKWLVYVSGASTTRARAAEPSTGGQEIWKIGEPQWWLDLRTGPGKGYTALAYLSDCAEMVMLEYGESWSHVQVVKGGQVGYVQTKWLVYVRSTEGQESGSPAAEDAVAVTVARDQLFRVYSVETNTEEGTVSVRAMHIFYDQRAALIEGELKPEKADIQATLSRAQNLLSYTPAITGHWAALKGKVTGEYSWRSVVEAILDPDDGMLQQVHGTLFRDNFDYYLLTDEEIDRCVTIRRGKNLVGVTVTEDDSRMITRIIPVGKDSDGEDLFVDGKYVDSPLIGEYPFIRVVRRDYDIKVDGEGDYPTEAKAKAALKERAEAEYYEDNADQPEYGMEVDFVALSDVEGYEEYADLQTIHMFDRVTVIDEVIGVKKALRVTAYVWDVNRRRYQSVTLGSLADLDQSYGFNVG